MGFQYKRIGSAPTDAHDGGVFDKFSNYQLEKQGQIYNHVEIPPEGHTATGGTVGDYYDPGGDYYRVHLFSEPGTFTVSSLSDTYAATIEYLVIGGGGGGGDGDGSGGGGAGGVKSSDPGIPAPVRGSALSVATAGYSVVVGEGGRSKRYGNSNTSFTASQGQGGTSSLAYNGGTISCGGGGGGGCGYNNGSGGTSAPGNLIHNGHAGVADNGSGGGGSSSGGTDAPTGGWAGGAGNGQGGDGGLGYHLNGIFIAGGGGGGSAGNGANAAPTSPTLGVAGVGGNGLSVVFFGPTNPVAIAGGGGGGGRGGPNVQQGANGGPGGGGAGSSESNGGNKTGGTGLNDGGPSLQGGNAGNGGHLTGSGGGGGSTDGLRAGNGGPGMVAIKYQISTAQTDTTTAKATGGQVTVYNDYAIHVFKSKGTFTNTSGSPITGIEYVAVGGGGAGGSGGGTITGGGGGAGGVVTNIPGLMPASTALPNTNSLGPGTPNSLTITVGGGGAAMASTPSPIDTGGLPGKDTTIASPTATLVTANGGGGGGGNDPGQVINVNGAATNDYTQPGGSGGGGAESDRAGGEGTAGQGNDGGTGSESANCAGGGGGAGAAGGAGGTPTASGAGGNGVQLPTGFRAPALSPSPLGAGLGAPGPGGNFWVAGGGSALYGIWSSGDFAFRAAGYGGGGRGIFGGGNGTPWSGRPQEPTLGPQMDGKTGEPGMMGSGGGGGGGPESSSDVADVVGGGHGGSGLVVIRYPTS